MKFIRRPFVLKTFAVFSLVVFLNQLVYPTASYALTSGPNQPEFTSYEDGSSSDMVNLLTGDFNFNLPVLTVPDGSDGGFSIPLSYHAGIGPDQEASWVGLGWNINVGSITRGINGFPDDAAGESQIVSVKDLTGRRGWNANFLGTSMGWDSQVGHYGVLNLGFKVPYKESGVSSVGLAGLYVSKNETSFSPTEFAITVAEVAMTILSYGAATTATQVWTQAALDVAQQVAMDAVMPDNIPTVATSGYWKYSREKDSKLFYSNYWIWLDQTRTEDMYGTLFLDRASQGSSTESNFVDDPPHLKVKSSINNVAQTVKQFPKSTTIYNKGAASDITIDLSSGNYEENNSPALLAYDNFFVNGPGISGSIKPYRLETGTVSVPREMTDNHRRLNLVPYVDYGANKVPFVYEGAQGNRYYHHNGGLTAPSLENYFGIDATKNGTATTGTVNTNTYQYNLNDVTFSADRIRADVAASKKIPQGHSIEWLTNGEIKNTTGAFINSPFLDYASGDERLSFRTNYDFGGRTTLYGSAYQASTGVITVPNSYPVQAGDILDLLFVSRYKDENMIDVYDYYSFKGCQVASVAGTSITLTTPPSISITPEIFDHVEITAKRSPKQDTMIGGFTITAADGMTYHYAIPVYDYDFYTKTTDATDANKYSTITRTGQFANTWLLTAITGPDFIDRGGVNNLGNGIVDTSDWGYWVKFNYGRYRSDYQWRIPYQGDRRTSDNAYTAYSQGATELYYLNSVETRSHVALFVKDSRRDNRDASTARRSTLRLGEIALLTRDAYTTLTDPAGVYKLKDCSGVRDVVYQYGGGDPAFSISGATKTYIEANAMRRVLFNADYSLCSGVLNSETGYGKLTLNSVSVLGQGNVKLFPDYKFTYGNNPAYAIDGWDGWGMYNSSGTASGNTHRASEFQGDGSAWSLSAIKSPLGSVVEIAYERDDYSSISGVVDIPVSVAGYPATDKDLSDGKTSVSPSALSVGDRVQLSLYDDYVCDEEVCEGQDGLPYSCPVNYSTIRTTLEGTVADNGVIVLDAPYNFGAGTVDCPIGGTVSTTPGSIIVSPKGNNRKGGNLRVRSITLKDEANGIQVKTRYIYTKDTNLWTSSSGVVSMEPDYIRTTEQDFYKWVGYPVTPVLYGKVTVLTGKMSTETDYDTKQVYEFETPDKAQYQTNIATNYRRYKQLVGTFLWTSAGAEHAFGEYSTLIGNTISSRASMIGKLRSIRQYDKVGNLYANQEYVYTSALVNDGSVNNQGVFTEGTLLFDVIDVGKARYHRAMRTAFVRYPYTLQKVITTVDGQTSTKENKSWDLYTGQVVVSDEKSPLGVTLRTVQEPVYKQYPELGSRAENPANKNMLSQMAATYTYRLDNAGSPSGLVGASATVWKKEWGNYRKSDASNVYGNTTDLDADGSGTVSTAEAQRKVWRKYAGYVWKGDYSRRQVDGSQTFTTADKFNFTTGAANTGWQKTGSQERYSHNSVILEAKDMNGMRSAMKRGYNDQFPIASAVRSGYEEMAFSGAEDAVSGNAAYFGGEVGVGTGTVVTTPVHTGRRALSVPTSGKGFVFKSASIQKNTVYRASVWCSSANGRIYYILNGAAAVTPVPVISSAVVLPSGTWYRIEVTFGSGPAPSTLEVGVTPTSGTAIFDDFRFQPRDAGMTCYVYDPATQQVVYTLGNDNLYTRFEYNNRGVVTKTYQETIQYGGEKLITESKDDFRRFHIDQ